MMGSYLESSDLKSTMALEQPHVIEFPSNQFSPSINVDMKTITTDRQSIASMKDEQAEFW